MEEVRVARAADGVARVTLDRPDAANALSRAINLHLQKVVAELGADSAVRVVVVTGSGDKAFCAGADLKERKGVSAAETGPYVEAIRGATRAFAELGKPTVAALNGHAFGGGLELALACDFRIAADHACFALTEVKLGILPGAGGTQRLPRLIGAARAKELILLGRRIDARRALEIGMVNDVVPKESLAAAVDALCAELAGCAPVSVAACKQAIDRAYDGTVADGLDLERKLYDLTLFTEDRNEGLRAFAEKRPPRFTGR